MSRFQNEYILRRTVMFFFLKNVFLFLGLWALQTNSRPSRSVPTQAEPKRSRFAHRL